MINFGLGLLLQNMTYLAVEHFKRLLEEDPTVIDAWLYLSTAYFNNKNFEKSYATSVVVLKLDPENMMIYGVRGLIYLEWGRYEIAIECFKKYLIDFPDDAAMLMEKAYCHYKIGQIDETIECYNKILRSFPHHREVKIVCCYL